MIGVTLTRYLAARFAKTILSIFFTIFCLMFVVVFVEMLSDFRGLPSARRPPASEIARGGFVRTGKRPARNGVDRTSSPPRVENFSALHQSCLTFGKLGKINGTHILGFLGLCGGLGILGFSDICGRLE